MAEKKDNTVIVRGMTSEWFMDHFKDMKVYFGGKYAVPKYDADFIGFYLGAPDSAITHVGIVESIDRESDPGEVTFHLKAIVKLDQPVLVEDHAIRKQEYWNFDQLGISKIAVVMNDFSRVGGCN